MNVIRGMRVHVRMLHVQPPGTYSLAGAQMKVAATSTEFIGTVVHIRGNHPTNPTSIRLWVKPDQEVSFSEKCEKCEQEEVKISPEEIVGVLSE